VILGVDPGACVGWALLTLDGHFHAAGSLDVAELGPRGIVLRLATLAPHGCHVAVETLEAVDHRPGFGPGMATDLCRTERLGGRIAQAFEDRGHVVLTPSAKEVRAHFFGQPSVDGAAVAALLAQRCPGWPKPRTTGIDGHARDAGAVALYAALGGP
jgi:hypothetical protein